MGTKVGIIGYGNHFKKNIEPVLKKLSVFSKKNILNKNNKQNFFNQKFDIVYISNQTKFHEEYIIKCLNHNYNIMCEKPFVIRKEKLNKILTLAKTKNLLLFECFMYRFHKIFYEIKKKIKNKEIKIVYSSFKIPGMNKKNFRYKKEHGSFFWDTAVYPLSLDIFLFDTKKKFKLIKNFDFLKGVIIQKNKNFLKIYKWGEGQKYENNLEIICSDRAYFVDKIFSKSKNEKITLEEIKNGRINKKIFVDNHFEKMFLEVFKKYNYKKFKTENINNIYKCFMNTNKVLEA